MNEWIEFFDQSVERATALCNPASQLPPFLGVDLSSQKNQTNLAEGWQLFVLFNESAGQQWDRLPNRRT
ncbi:MAG: hypothetical protein IPJ84_20150 [Bdellovibrionales bacterium]|nr:hypothetical protein [Bdellovibrionales bacterium]